MLINSFTIPSVLCNTRVCTTEGHADGPAPLDSPARARPRADSQLDREWRDDVPATLIRLSLPLCYWQYVDVVLFRSATIVDDPVLGRLCGYRYTPSLLNKIVK